MVRDALWNKKKAHFGAKLRIWTLKKLHGLSKKYSQKNSTRSFPSKALGKGEAAPGLSWAQHKQQGLARAA